MDTGQFKVTRHTGESAGSVTAGQSGISIEVSTQPVYFARGN
jgi:hypothetical protein